VQDISDAELAIPKSSVSKKPRKPKTEKVPKVPKEPKTKTVKNKKGISTKEEQSIDVSQRSPKQSIPQEPVKYSGRVAEGIRGNSRERSSSEFIEKLEYNKLDSVKDMPKEQPAPKKSRKNTTKKLPKVLPEPENIKPSEGESSPKVSITQKPMDIKVSQQPIETMPKELAETAKSHIQEFKNNASAE
jgi:hypothetical protein